MRRIQVDPAVHFAWALANAEACFAGASRIEPVHFFAAMLSVLDEVFADNPEQMGLPPEGAQALKDFGAFGRSRLRADEAGVARALNQLHRQLRVGQPRESLKMLHRSEESREMFRCAARRALSAGASALTLHDIWEELLVAVAAEVKALFPDSPSDDKRPVTCSTEPSQEAEWQSASNGVNRGDRVSRELRALGRDLTALALSNSLPPIVGRKGEIKATARFLSRTTKRGVLLLGAPGVGKTAIVEGLAQAAARENAPAALSSLRIVQLNIADLIAGTRYRGDMEKRVVEIVAEAEADPNLVLFLDEVHLAVKTGGDSPLDVANILKPALARDRLRCIGATTTEEFERFIRPDGAFARRFQIVRVEEPTMEETLEIASAWSARIASLQGVEFEDGAVAAAVALATEHLSDRAAPDATVDLLENAATFATVSTLSEKAKGPKKARPSVGVELLEEVLRELHGISVRAGESFDLARVRSGLEECIVGQRAAIDRVVASLDNVRLPGRSKNRPLLVLMFAGPTGVGKTYAAECLSESLFGPGTSRFARFNMSELKERHELARLIGAPPGFVGHDREPALFNFVRSKRQGLILLDEMDKAHPEIQDYFLEVFDKGIARDSHGKQEDFRRIVFVITCNLNVQQQFNTKIGFEAQAPAESKTDEAPPAGLAEHFRPEFIARLDGIAHFKKLTIEDLEELLGRRLTAFVEMLQQDRPVTVQISPATRKAVTARCGGQGEDVREFLRKVERVLFRPLQDHLRRETVATQVSITYEDGAVVISDS